MTATHTWHWRAALPGRKGQACRVIAASRMGSGRPSPQIANPPPPKNMGSIAVRFADGFTVITSRHAVRRIT